MPSGDLVFGRTRDCCDYEGRWYTEAEECSPRPRHDWWLLDFGLGYTWERFHQPTLEKEWQFDGATVDAALHLPSIFAGGLRFEPVLHGGIGQGDVTFHANVAENEVPTQYRGTGTLLDGGAGLLIKPTKPSPWTWIFDYRHRTLRDAEPFLYRIQEVLVSSELDYSADDTMVAVQYSVLADRLATRLGARFSRASATADTVIYNYGFDADADVDLNKNEIVAGMDIQLSQAFSSHLEMASDGEHTRGSIGLRYRFGNGRVLPSPEPVPVPDPLPSGSITGPEQDCASGIAVCQMKYVQQNSYTGSGSVHEAAGTCLADGETNSVWYVFTAQNSGSLAFTIDTARDYDFALYNITGGGCVSVETTMPVRCNYSGIFGQTGLQLPATNDPVLNVTSGSPLMPALNVTAGETFALVVDNYTADNAGYTLTFGGTAAITDGTAPALVSAVVNPSSDEIEITLSEPIRCSSIAADGSDFTVTAPEGVTITSASGVNCGAFTNKVLLKFELVNPNACGVWTVTSRSGSDGNSLLDNCGNALPAGSKTTLPVSPSAVPKLTLPSLTFCEDAPIIADGSGSELEARHFWSVVEADANWNVIGKECMRWFEGPAGTLDVRQFAQAEGCSLECNRYYRVKLAVQNCATKWSETVQLIRIQCPVADAGPDKSVCCCGPQKIQIGSAPVAGVQYSWSPATGLSDPNIANPTIDMSLFNDPAVPFPSIYEVTATDNAGCKAKDDVYIKTVCGCRPGATITTSTPGICSSAITLTANCACGEATPSYLWSNGATTQSISVSGGGTFSVTCSNECGATVSKPVTVPAVSPLTGGFPGIECPNVFTPNGDGINDLWTVKDLSKPVGAVPAYNATEYELLVFNRWGNEIAILNGSTSTGFANGSIPGWNGITTQNVFYSWWERLWGKENTYAGTPVKAGVYPYIFRMRNCTTGWTDVCHGFIHVLR